jgi:hypothetical protein
MEEDVGEQRLVGVGAVQPRDAGQLGPRRQGSPKVAVFGEMISSCSPANQVDVVGVEKFHCATRATISSSSSTMTALHRPGEWFRLT